MFRNRACHHSIFICLHLQLLPLYYYFIRPQNAFRSTQIEMTRPCPLTLTTFLYWFPNWDPSCTHHLLPESSISLWDVPVDHPGVQASLAEPGTASSLANNAASVPYTPLGEVWAYGFGWLSRGMFLVDHLLVLLAISCTFAGHVLHGAVLIKLQSRHPQ